MYGKIFDSMYDGTLYGHWEAIVTFQQMIVLADADGMVDMTPHALAARTSIPFEIIQKGLKVLESPDPYSRTPGEDGKRIELIDEHRPWGWHIVNHNKYKSLQDSDTIRAQTRERVKRHREMKRLVTDGNAQKRHTDTDTDTRKALSGKPDYPADFVRFWEAWPRSERKQGKSKCLAIWKRKKLGLRVDQILAHIEVMKRTDSWRTGYDPLPKTYLNDERWDGAELESISILGQCMWNLNDNREPGRGRCEHGATVEKASGVYCKAHAERVNG